MTLYYILCAVLLTGVACYCLHTVFRAQWTIDRCHHRKVMLEEYGKVLHPDDEREYMEHGDERRECRWVEVK